MAKRKLLNNEREIILSKTLQHVFKDVLITLNDEYKVINDNFINWYKQFIKTLSNLEYEKCAELSNKNLINKCHAYATEGTLLIKDNYFSSFKSDKERISFYTDISTTIKNVYSNQKRNFSLDFSRYVTFTGNYTAFTEQRYAQSVRVYGEFLKYIPSFGSVYHNGILNTIALPQYTDEMRKEFDTITADYASLNQKLNQVINDLTELCHTLKIQLKAITTAEALKDLLPVAYSFLPPLEEREPTKRRLASKALISYGTIAHLNGLLNTGYQL